MTTSAQKTLILGPEYDNTLREALHDVLTRLGAKGLAHDWGVGGSQELETAEVQVGVDRVIVEAETFIGLSIRGPVELVERIRGMVVAAMNQP
jgi:hypothetical protein